jgi:hypothetical protein
MKGTAIAILIDSSKVLDLLGDNGERWAQGTWGNEQSTCLHGAIRRCHPQPGDAYLVEQVARRQGWGTTWNDDNNTTFADVKARILDGLDVSDADLADTFGPQWEQIVAFTRRAAVLTHDEGQRLVAARDSAGHAAQGIALNTAECAAEYAAEYAGRLDAWYAAWDAVRNAADWDATRYVPRYIARGATRALVVRDLIGQHDFTQAHYDTLTRSWRTVIGPAHPDDRITVDTH